LLSVIDSPKIDEAFQCGTEIVTTCLSGHCSTVLDIIPADIRSFYPVSHEEANYDSFASCNNVVPFRSNVQNRVFIWKSNFAAKCSFHRLDCF